MEKKYFFPFFFGLLILFLGTVCFFLWGSQREVIKEYKSGELNQKDESVLLDFSEKQKLEEKILEKNSPIDGWKRYYSIDLQDSVRAFVLFYPSDGKIEKAAGFSVALDKLSFVKMGKDCWIIPNLPGVGLDGDSDIQSSGFKKIVMGKFKWDETIWMQKNKAIFHYFFLDKPDTYFSIGVNPDNFKECQQEYKKIIATFEIID